MKRPTGLEMVGDRLELAGWLPETDGDPADVWPSSRRRRCTRRLWTEGSSSVTQPASAGRFQAAKQRSMQAQSVTPEGSSEGLLASR